MYHDPKTQNQITGYSAKVCTNHTSSKSIIYKLHYLCNASFTTPFCSPPLSSSGTTRLIVSQNIRLQYRMPRQRSSAFAVSSSSSKSGSHTAHESRRSMHPGLQARAIDAKDSEPPRTSRVQFAGLPESVRDDEESQPSKPSTQASITGLSEPVHESGTGLSTQPQASLSSHCLDPQNTINTQYSDSHAGSSTSSNDQPAQIASAPESSSNHSVPTQNEYSDPRYGAWVRTSSPKAQTSHQTYLLINLCSRDM